MRSLWNISVVSMIGLFFLPVGGEAQTAVYSQPSWWIGGAAGANFNFSSGNTRQLNEVFRAPLTFHKGRGAGLYAAPTVEYHFRGTGLGILLQAGFDSRNSALEGTLFPCNCPADLSVKLSYFTIEPSLRYSPLRTGFYIFGGPRLAFNLEKSFNYQIRGKPDLPEQVVITDLNSDFSNIRNTLLSMQVGAGYDFRLTQIRWRRQLILSPFVAFQPYFGQSPRSSETWNITSLRAGLSLKMGSGRKVHIPEESQVFAPEVQFTVYSPENIPIERRVRETFPLRNYVFFDSGSTLIPNRYMLLTPDQVKNFKEDQLEVFTPKSLSGRAAREMTVYYNILNILGDRMNKHPFTVITLVGSSARGPADGEKMAESIKRYLVEVFDISSARIAVHGLDKPKLPSEHPGSSTLELDMLRAGDQRVSIESDSPDLLMEFESGRASLRPVTTVGIQNAPLDSYVSFYVKGAEELLASWSIDIKDKSGNVQSLGPFYEENVRIPGKFILGDRPEGVFTVTMTGQKKNGKTVKQNAIVKMKRWKPPVNEEGMRFSVIYEFDESKVIPVYQKYLSTVVMPLIPIGGTVIIHGHTDIIGDAAYNRKLSLARANDVKGILETSLKTAGRTDVKLDVYGWGEDQSLSPFNNQYPEERFYNRTVIIDIIPPR